MRKSYAAAAVLALSLAGCAKADGTPAQEASKPAIPPAQNEARPQSPAESKALADFANRLDAYVALHRRLEATLPNLPKETTPAIADKHQRALEKLILTERKNAKRGDIFTPEVEVVVKRLLLRVFGGPDGKQLKASIMDENPMGIKLAVNSRYPDEVPMSTVPPQVLSSLPKLPEEIEYRFIGDRLILLDVHSHTVIDYIDNALPA